MRRPVKDGVDHGGSPKITVFSQFVLRKQVFFRFPLGSGDPNPEDVGPSKYRSLTAVCDKCEMNERNGLKGDN